MPRIVGEAVRHDRVQIAVHAMPQRCHGLVALFGNLTLRRGVERVQRRQHAITAVAQIASHRKAAQHRAHGVDVAAHVGSVHAHAQQFGCQVVRRADDRARLLVGVGWLEGCMGHAEVDHLHAGLVGLERQQDVRGLQVAVHQAMFMRVMDAAGHIRHETHAFVHGQSRGVACFGDGRALREFHGEPWAAVVGFTGLEHLHQRGMAEQREQASFGLETRATDRIHAIGSQQLQRHGASQRFVLRGKPHHTEATLAQHAAQGVGAHAHGGRLRLLGLKRAGWCVATGWKQIECARELARMAVQHGAQRRGTSRRRKRQHATNGFLGADRFLRHSCMVRRWAATLRG